MEVLHVESKVIKWSKTDDTITGKIKEGDKPTFELMPHHPVNKSLFVVYNNIHITTVDTDFILDIYIDTLIQFDIKTPIPTTKDLYDAYLAVKDNEDGTIIENKELEDVWFYLNSHGRNMKRRPFDSIKMELGDVIMLVYPYN